MSASFTPLVLASRSEARARLMAAVGYRFRQVPSRVAESAICRTGKFGAQLAALARAKAEAVADRYPDAFVIGADTAVAAGPGLVGKPGTLEEAMRILTSLAGRTHTIATAVCVIGPVRGNRSVEKRALLAGVESASVTMRAIDRRSILEYVRRVRPLNCAGGYALQGGGCAILERIDGDPSTVVGLPMALLAKLLRKAGYRVR